MEKILNHIWRRLTAIVLILVGISAYLGGNGHTICNWAACVFCSIGFLAYAQIMLDTVHPNRKGWVL